MFPGFDFLGVFAGYINIARNANNMCGIASAGAYPTV